MTEYAKIEHPLRSAYTYTLKFDDSRMEELKDFILKFGEETSERKANRFYQNPDSPRYNKSFGKAAENGEKYFFIASYNRDMMCMEYFESNISTANHSGKTDDFIKSWVSKFGVEQEFRSTSAIPTRRMTREPGSWRAPAISQNTPLPVLPAKKVLFPSILIRI